MSERAPPPGVDPETWRSFLDALREAAEFAEKPEAERQAEIAAVLKAGFQLLEGRPDRERLLLYRDPVAPESQAVLARLREAWAKRAEQ